jgi:hypothetical protein
MALIAERLSMPLFAKALGSMMKDAVIDHVEKPTAN